MKHLHSDETFNFTFIITVKENALFIAKGIIEKLHTTGIIYAQETEDKRNIVVTATSVNGIKAAADLMDNTKLNVARIEELMRDYDMGMYGVVEYHERLSKFMVI